MKEQETNNRREKRLPIWLHLCPALIVLLFIGFAIFFTKPVLAEVPDLEGFDQKLLEGRLTESSAETETSASVNTTSSLSSQKTIPTVKHFVKPDHYRDGIYTGSAAGFGGKISVRVTIQDHAIQEIVILQADGETPSYFATAKKVINRILTAQSPDVDTVSGATYSSAGILNAVVDALSQASGENETNKTAPSSSTIDPSPRPEKPQQESTKVPVVLQTQYRDGIYKGTGEGFNGDITVQVTIKNGTIQTIQVLEDQETPAYFQKAKAVLSRIIKAQNTAVDSISGATYSSCGILDAVSNALQGALSESESESSKESSKNESTVQRPDKESPSEESSTETESSKESSAETESSTEVILPLYCDGTYMGTAVCRDRSTFDYEVSVEVTIAEGRIITITASKEKDSSGMNDSYFNYAVKGRKVNGVMQTGVVEQILFAQSTEHVDAVSRATYSSKAITEAVAKALEEAASAAKGEETLPKEP